MRKAFQFSIFNLLLKKNISYLCWAMRMKRINVPFYYGASPEMLKRAERLRKEMTEAELLLWERLRKNKNESYRFRAQHPIGKFIVDFYCHKALLVIEIDGGIHQNKIRCMATCGCPIPLSPEGKAYPFLFSIFF